MLKRFHVTNVLNFDGTTIVIEQYSTKNNRILQDNFQLVSEEKENQKNKETLLNYVCYCPESFG